MENTKPNNVTNITDKQTAPSARFSISASLHGFPVVVEVEGKADALRAMIDRLKAIGAEPPASAPAPQANSDNAKKAPPKCPVHRSPMKESRGGKGFYCPRKDDDGYCDETA